MITEKQALKLLGKVCGHYLKQIRPNGIAVIDKQTDEKFCIFIDETDLLHIQHSETIEYDLVECEIAEHLN